MNDRAYEQLVQLFALVASVRESKDVGERRMVVFEFLESELNTERATELIGKFDDYYREFIHSAQRSDTQYKVIARVSSKALKIANELNVNLTPYQKYLVIIELYIYLNTGKISFIERGFVQDIIADKFKINREEFETIRDFIISTDDVTERVVFSGDQNCENITEPKHVFWEDIEGEICFIYIPTINIFLFKCRGTDKMAKNGEKLKDGMTYILRAGGSIRNEVSAPIFYYDVMRHVVTNNTGVPINFEVRNVMYKFTDEVVGLHKMSFEAHSGSLVGIMGTSGSGKSTLANVISGMSEPDEGHIYINNIDIYENPEELKGLVGYVSQDDILMEDLTVYENLYYNAKMSFDNVPTEGITQKIDKLLEMLGLYEVKDVKVGSPQNKKISGGQRKRLNIALELIREPAILILDEPTSGLSSHDSELIIDMLKRLTIDGKLIFVVIHQPSSTIFKMFDKLLILDTGGYLIYDGNPIECLNHFRAVLGIKQSQEIECHRCGNINVEEILNIISTPRVDEYGNSTNERKISPKEWYEAYFWGVIDMSYVGDPEPLPPISFKTPNLLKQLYIFLARDVRSKLANLQYCLQNLLEAPLMALFVGVLLRYYDVSSGEGYTYSGNSNMPVFLIVSVIIAFFVGLTVSAEEIIQDRQILKRERFLNLSRTSYIMSKCAQTTFLSAIQMMLYVMVSNTIMDIRGMGFEYWLVLFSTAVSANLLGLNLSDMMKKTINIYVIIPFMVIPQLILSGVFVKFEKMNPDMSSSTGVPAYGQIIAARWAFEALIVNQFCYNEYERVFYQYDKAKSQCSYYKDYWVPTMRSNLNRVTRNASEQSSDPEEIARILKLLSDEIQDPKNQFADIKVPRADMFSEGLFGTAAYNVVNQYLESVRMRNVSLYNKVDIASDRIRKNYTASELDSLRLHYYNKSIEDFVTNPAGIMSEAIGEYDGRLWQRNDQVYQNTDAAFSAPLFTPHKTFRGEKYDTYIFDVMVIWFLNLVLMLFLLDGHVAAWMRK